MTSSRFSLTGNTYLRIAPVVIVALLVAACGGSKPPTAPSLVVPTPPVVVVVPPPVVVVVPPPVVPPFSGSWSGTYIVERCDGTGSMQDLLCSAPAGSRPGGIFPVGTSLPLTLTLMQSGSAVSGTFALGTISGVGTGVVVNGLLTLQGTARGGTTTAVITHWSTRVIGNVMDGFASYNVSVSGVPGTVILVTRFGRVTK